MASIRLKAVLVVFAVVAVTAGFLSIYLPAKHIASIDRAMRAKAAAYARLVAKEVGPGVAFGDREKVREVFAATAEDEDVSAMTLYDAQGHALASFGDFIGRASPPAQRPDAVETTTGPAFVRAVAPVVSKEGPAGTLVLEVSTRRVDAERRDIQRTAFAAGIGALLLGFLAAWWAGRSLGRRIEAIAAATKAVAAGDRTVRPVEDPSADEVGQLARSFNAMFANLQTLVDQMRAASAEETERLDVLVKVRTAELDARTHDMRVVLDNVDQGLLVVERSGCIAPDHSSVVADWFNPPGEDTTFWDFIGAFDPRAAATFQLNWEGILEEVMPLELLIDQLPHRMTAGRREYELDFRPLFDDEGFSRMLVVISDITRRRAAERAEAEQRELASAFGHIVRDRAGFLEFVDDARSLVERLCAQERGSLGDVKRWLHTLKGNALLFGLAGLGAYCHGLEDSMEETGEDLTVEQRDALLQSWEGFCTRFESLLGGRDDHRIPVNDEDYEALLAALVEGHPRPAIASMVVAWKLELACDRLARHAEQAKSLAHRLGKGQIDCSVDAGRLRLAREAMAPFWSVFGHAVRNAIAHGLETPEDRATAGKPPAGALRLSARKAADHVIIEIADDGRGIDWAGVRRKAAAAGLPSETEQQLVEALFHDGLTTREETDDVAGRGVGMGALRVECERLGGDVSIVSAAGIGTTVRFALPLDVTGQEEARLHLGPIRPGPGSIASGPRNPSSIRAS